MLQQIKALQASANKEFNSWSEKPDQFDIPLDTRSDGSPSSYEACQQELEAIVEDFKKKCFDEVAFQKLLGLKYLIKKIKPHNATNIWDQLINGIEFIDDVLKVIYFCAFDDSSYRGPKALETIMEKKLSQVPSLEEIMLELQSPVVLVKSNKYLKTGHTLNNLSPCSRYYLHTSR